jgi:hypothetical protein
LRLALGFGLRDLPIVQGLAFQGPKLRAIALQHLNQIALRLDGSALLDDQQRHQDVGSYENYGEQRQKVALLFWSRDWHRGCAAEQSRQVPPLAAKQRQV